MDSNWIRNTRKRLGATRKATIREEFHSFKVRVMNALAANLNLISPEGIHLFYQVVSAPSKYVESLAGPRLDPILILEKLAEEEDEKQFLFLLQVVVELPLYPDFGLMGHYERPRAKFLAGLQQAVRLSDFDVELTVTSERVIVRPRGDPDLEGVLVDEVTGTLRRAALNHYTAALESYGKGTAAEHVKSAESLRRALEEFLRERLSNSKGLSANISELQGRLKGSRRDPAIRNIIFQVFSHLDKYYNENSKHADGDIDASENEYLFYQTGVLIRYIDRVLKRP